MLIFTYNSKKNENIALKIVILNVSYKSKL